MASFSVAKNIFSPQDYFLISFFEVICKKCSVSFYPHERCNWREHICHFFSFWYSNRLPWWNWYYVQTFGTMTVVLTLVSVGAEPMAAATWDSILILLLRICLIFCPTVGITNRSILRHNQGLDWTSLHIIYSHKHLLNHHRNAVRNFASVAEVIALYIFLCYCCESSHIQSN